MHAAFTQSQQKLSAVASALGIPKTSTAEQFVAAITARRKALVEEEAELAQDPRVAAAIARARQHEERFVQQQYPEASVIALAVLDAAKGTGSLTDLAEIVNTALYEAAAKVAIGANPAPAGGTQPSQPQQPAQAAPPPERRFLGESLPRGGDGMFDPGITRDQAKTPEGFFQQLRQRVPGL